MLTLKSVRKGLKAIKAAANDVAGSVDAGVSEAKSAATEAAFPVIDAIADATGYSATRVPLSRGDDERSTTLDLPGYRQLDSYSCGAVAGFMVLKYLRPKQSFESFYAKVEPKKASGTSTKRLIQGLRDSGLKVARRKDMDFEEVARLIEDDEIPLIVTVTIDGADYDHWVVVYGVGRKPKTVFIAGNAVFGSDEVPWKEFRRRWTPRGEGIYAWRR